jgi:hypothetical protein
MLSRSSELDGLLSKRLGMKMDAAHDEPDEKEPSYVTTSLTNFKIQANAPADNGEFVEKVLRFIGAQTDLKDLKIPILSSYVLPATAKREKLLLTSVLPEAAHTVYFCSDNALYPDIFDDLPSLKTLTVHCTDTDGHTNKLLACLKQNTYPELRSLTLVEEPGRIRSLLLAAFPNLVKLKIESGTVTDEGLQLIIQNLAQLQCLDLHSISKITDFGVTGIPEKECKALWDLRSFYLQGQEPSFFGNDETGYPLSSLKCK